MGKLSNTITLTKKEEIQQGGGNTATPYNWFSLVDSNLELYPTLEEAATKEIDRVNRTVTWTFNREVEATINEDYIIRISRIEVPMGKTYTFSCRLESQLDLYTQDTKIFIQVNDRNWRNTEWDLSYYGDTKVDLKDHGQYLVYPNDEDNSKHYRFLDININKNARIKGHVGKKVVLKDIMFYEGTGDLGYIPNPKDVIQNNLDQNPAATIKPTLTRRRVAVNGMECYDGKSGPEGWRENVLDLVVPSDYTNFTLQNLPIFKCIKPYTFNGSFETTQNYLETYLREYFTSINIKDFDYIDTVVSNYVSAKSIDTNQIIFKKGQDKWGQIVANPSDNYYMWIGGNNVENAAFKIDKNGSVWSKGFNLQYEDVENFSVNDGTLNKNVNIISTSNPESNTFLKINLKESYVGKFLNIKTSLNKLIIGQSTVNNLDFGQIIINNNKVYSIIINSAAELYGNFKSDGSTVTYNCYTNNEVLVHSGVAYILPTIKHNIQFQYNILITPNDSSIINTFNKNLDSLNLQLNDIFNRSYMVGDPSIDTQVINYEVLDKDTFKWISSVSDIQNRYTDYLSFNTYLFSNLWLIKNLYSKIVYGILEIPLDFNRKVSLNDIMFIQRLKQMNISNTRGGEQFYSTSIRPSSFPSMIPISKLFIQQNKAYAMFKVWDKNTQGHDYYYSTLLFHI